MENETETVSAESSAAPSFEEAASQAIDAATEADPSQDTQSTEAAGAKTEAPTQSAQAAEPNWDTLPEWARKERQTYSERYENLRKQWTKTQTEHKKLSEEFPKYKTQAEQLAYLEKLYDSNPEVQAVLNKHLGIKSEVDPSIQEDPLFKYLQGYQSQLDQKLKPIMDFYQTAQQQAQEAKLDAQVEKVTSSATAEYKKYFGKEPNEQDMAQIYKHMHENKVYHGESAVRAVFMEKLLEAKVQEKLNEQMAKKGKSARVSSVNSNSAQSAKGPMSFEEHAASILDELGFQ